MSTIHTTDRSDRSYAEVLIRRASNEVNVFGTVCVDTAALLIEEGIDINTLQGFDSPEDYNAD